MSSDPPIDWDAIANAIGHASGKTGSDEAVMAICKIIGDDECAHAVDKCLDFAQTSDLIQQVLRLLKPFPAMVRCHQIFKSRDSDMRRCAAVGLLRHIGDGRVLNWIPDMLADAATAANAAVLVEQLLWHSHTDRPSVQSILATMKDHRIADVREAWSRIEAQNQGRSK